MQAPEPILGYDDFRVIGESPEHITLAADIDADELQRRAIKRLDYVAYCSFHVTPMFAY